jgi:hypothetical protein
MRYIRTLAAAAAIIAATGCDIEVTNPNNPDRGRVLGNPADVEALAAAQFQQIVSATLGSIARVQTGMMTASLMNASGLANNGMGPRSGIPRQPIDNNVGNAYEAENFADYRLLSFVARNSADILARIKAPEFQLAGGAGDLNRLKAWSHFVYGLSLGYLSLVYDQAGVPRPDDAPGSIPGMLDAADLNALALAELDSAVAYASASGTTDLPSGWLTGPSGVTVPVARFVQVIRSYKAVVRAGVARTPAERATAVDWNQVVADATAGITSDLVVRMLPSAGWDYSWLATGLHYRDANWHQMTYYIIGMADVSGGFDAWLSVARDSRTPFLIITPDLRFPQGGSRAEQTRPADDDDDPLPAGQYFRNRNSGKDQSATGWANSWYDHYRFRAFADAKTAGANFPLLTRAEIDMLAAEGHIRLGAIGSAATLIDRTRTAAGLPALTGVVTNATQPVPGGAECVPRVPTPAGPTQCGNILEAMKWEKRLETAYTSYGAWFFDGRGWGDLPIGTALYWPVPVQDLNARGIPTYNIGGEGRPGGATESTYGYGVGSR